MTRQWVYRPTEREHEVLARFLAENREFTSAAQVVREGVLRLIHADNRKPLYTEIGDLIDDLKETKEKFLMLVLSHSEESRR